MEQIEDKIRKMEIAEWNLQKIETGNPDEKIIFMV